MPLGSPGRKRNPVRRLLLQAAGGLRAGTPLRPPARDGLAPVMARIRGVLQGVLNARHEAVREQDRAPLASSPVDPPPRPPRSISRRRVHTIGSDAGDDPSLCKFVRVKRPGSRLRLDPSGVAQRIDFAPFL